MESHHGNFTARKDGFIVNWSYIVPHRVVVIHGLSNPTGSWLPVLAHTTDVACKSFQIQTWEARHSNKEHQPQFPWATFQSLPLVQKLKAAVGFPQAHKSSNMDHKKDCKRECEHYSRIYKKIGDCTSFLLAGDANEKRPFTSRRCQFWTAIKGEKARRPLEGTMSMKLVEVVTTGLDGWGLLEVEPTKTGRLQASDRAEK